MLAGQRSQKGKAQRHVSLDEIRQQVIAQRSESLLERRVRRLRQVIRGLVIGRVLGLGGHQFLLQWRGKDATDWADFF